ncbi:hypothetical protein MFRU_006g01570 [Monilinia fructicola]|nr:hypothetical protein MFRU_006g01570 [Monilinia fructicola]
MSCISSWYHIYKVRTDSSQLDSSDGSLSHLISIPFPCPQSQMLRQNSLARTSIHSPLPSSNSPASVVSQLITFDVILPSALPSFKSLSNQNAVANQPRVPIPFRMCVLCLPAAYDNRSSANLSSVYFCASRIEPFDPYQANSSHVAFSISSSPSSKYKRQPRGVHNASISVMTKGKDQKRD